MNADIFSKQGYCYVDKAIGSELAEFIMNYTLIKEKTQYTLEKDFIQVPNAHSQYGDILMESLLVHLLPTVEKNTGLSLLPTYTYYRVYRSGNELKPHTDRYSCEISATLCLGYNYDDSNGGYPIIMDGEAYSQKPGDMVVYRGIDLVHSRPVFEADSSAFHSQVFLHYVDINGPHAEWAYDKREGLGLPKN